MAKFCREIDSNCSWKGENGKCYKKHCNLQVTIANNDMALAVQYMAKVKSMLEKAMATQQKQK